MRIFYEDVPYIIMVLLAIFLSWKEFGFFSTITYSIIIIAWYIYPRSLITLMNKINQAVECCRLVKEKRKLLKEEVELTRELSLDESFTGYRSMITTDLCALENRLVKVRARLAELKEVKGLFGQKVVVADNKDNTGFPHNHLAVLGIDKMKRYAPLEISTRRKS